MANSRTIFSVATGLVGLGTIVVIAVLLLRQGVDTNPDTNTGTGGGTSGTGSAGSAGGNTGNPEPPVAVGRAGRQTIPPGNPTGRQPAVNPPIAANPLLAGTFSNRVGRILDV